LSAKLREPDFRMLFPQIQRVKLTDTNRVRDFAEVVALISSRPVFVDRRNIRDLTSDEATTDVQLQEGFGGLTRCGLLDGFRLIQRTDEPSVPILLSEFTRVEPVFRLGISIRPSPQQQFHHLGRTVVDQAGPQ
jgi:hypothetical protein